MRLDKIQQNKLNHTSYHQSLKYHIKPDNKIGEEWRMSCGFWTARGWFEWMQVLEAWRVDEIRTRYGRFAGRAGA